MGEETLTVDGEQITVTTEENLHCQQCDHRWIVTDGDYQCPKCGHRDKVRLVTEDFTERGKLLYYGTGTIEDMAETLERRAKFLRAMKESGWERRGVAGDDYSRLTKTE
jgi:DNA-directed RNA polymerase subunit RPC12/RpoP